MYFFGFLIITQIYPVVYYIRLYILMDAFDGILLVVIIILTIIILRKKSGKTAESASTRSWDCVDRQTGELTTVNMKTPKVVQNGDPRAATIESDTHAANAEYFCGGSDTTASITPMCADDDTFQYAVDPFGAPDMEYKDWVTSQAVDSQVIKNHSEFVKDRFLGNPQNVTGRTYSPDYHDSYDPMPWIGIRGRPQAVAICNPTQMPDMDISMFAQGPKLTWNSAATQ